jgi:hypothetical protein
MPLGIGAAGGMSNAGVGGPKGGPKNPGGNNGPKGDGEGGTNQNGVPISPKSAPKLRPIPGVPDNNGGATEQDPIDLSLIAGPQQLPERRPLVNASVAIPSTGVTGYAGEK